MAKKCSEEKEEGGISSQQNDRLTARGSSGISKFTGYLNYLTRSHGPHSANRLGGWHHTLTNGICCFSALVPGGLRAEEAR